MVTRKRKSEEDMAATDPHVTPAPQQPSTLADDTISEYEMPDGLTYMLTAKEAETRGAKAVGKPANKAVTPQNK